MKTSNESESLWYPTEIHPSAATRRPRVQPRTGVTYATRRAPTDDALRPVVAAADRLLTRGPDQPLPTAAVAFFIAVGGRFGAWTPTHRPLPWLEHLHGQCAAAGVAFFCKQDSGPHPGRRGRIPDPIWLTKQWSVPRGAWR